MWVGLSTPTHNDFSFVVGTIYIPPNSPSSYFEPFYHNLECVTSTDNKVILMGDFNIDQTTEKDKETTKIEDEFGLVQLIMSPTRVTLTSSSTTDLIFTSDPNLHNHTGVYPLALSDHYMNFTTVLTKSPPEKNAW